MTITTKPLHWFTDGLNKYATFTGRAHRTAFWVFAICVAILGVLVGFLDLVGLGIVESIYMLAMIVPCLAISVRRLHDVNRSGWWLLIGIIPFVGWLVLLVWAIRESDSGNNRFGAPLSQ